MSVRERGSSGTTLSRRQFLIAGAAAVATTGAGAESAAGSRTTYPKLRITPLAKLKPNHPMTFNYPLATQASVLLDMGQPVPAGVGPKKSIIAYSLFCQHMGCPVEYQPAIREFVCPCHQSRYDPERLGSIIQGVAPLPLPRVLLQVKQGAVWAVGVDGLIYGYRNNLHPGKAVGGAK
jgi:arsenite oxidase small subunit